MPDAERLRLQFEKLDERVTELREIAAKPRAAFLADPIARSAAERLLQNSIQSCLDVGNHLISEMQLRRPATYGDVFIILGEAGILPEDFAGELARMARFRNRLVHLYDEISPDELYDILQERLGDFGRFAASVMGYVGADEAGGTSGG